MQSTYACLLSQWARATRALPQNFLDATRGFLLCLSFSPRCFQRDDGRRKGWNIQSTVRILLETFLSRWSFGDETYHFRYARRDCSIIVRENRELSRRFRFSRFALFSSIVIYWLSALCVNRKLSAHAISTSHGHMRILRNSDNCSSAGGILPSVNIRSIRIPAENSPDARRIFIDDNPASRWRRFISASWASKSDRPVYVPACKNARKRLYLPRLDAIERQEEKWEIRALRRYQDETVNFGLILSTREESSYANMIFSCEENSCSVIGYCFCNATDYLRKRNRIPAFCLTFWHVYKVSAYRVDRRYRKRWLSPIERKHG